MRKFKISVLLKLGFYCLFLSIGLEMQARKFVHPGILHTTKSIERMRHVLVHGYYTIDPESLWATIEDDIPELKPWIVKFLSD